MNGITYDTVTWGKNSQDLELSNTILFIFLNPPWKKFYLCRKQTKIPKILKNGLQKRDYLLN
jgi:hypothetical protein